MGLEKKFMLNWVSSSSTAKWVFWGMDDLEKFYATADLPKTVTDIWDVDHSLWWHSTMSKQGVLKPLPLFLSPPIFCPPPLKHWLLDHVNFESGLMRSLLHFLVTWVQLGEHENMCFLWGWWCFSRPLPIVFVCKDEEKLRWVLFLKEGSDFVNASCAALRGIYYCLHRAGYAERML